MWNPLVSESQDVLVYTLSPSPGLIISATRRYRSDECDLLSVLINLTDVTLVSYDTYRRLY